MKKFFTLISIFACCAIGAMAQVEVQSGGYKFKTVSKIQDEMLDGSDDSNRRFVAKYEWDEAIGMSALYITAEGELTSYKYRTAGVCPTSKISNDGGIITFGDDGVVRPQPKKIQPDDYSAYFGYTMEEDENDFLSIDEVNKKYFIDELKYGYQGWYEIYGNLLAQRLPITFIDSDGNNKGYHYAFFGSYFTNYDSSRKDVQGYLVNPKLLYIAVATDGSQLWKTVLNKRNYEKNGTETYVKLYPICYAEYSDEVDEYGTEEAEYTVVKLTSELFEKATNSIEVVIPSTVSDIESGCFVNSYIERFTVSSRSRYFVASADGKLLYTADANGLPSKLIAVSKAVKRGDTVTLDDACTSIADEAFLGYTGVTFVTKNPKLIYNESKLNGNSVELPNYTLSFKQSRILTSVSSLVSDYVDRYAVVLEGGGMITADGVHELLTSVKNKSNVCYIDLTSGVVEGTVGSIDLVGMGFNRNCVIYFPAKAGATGDNVVNGESCENLVLARESASPFYAPKRFTAAYVKVTGMGLKGNMVGYCLPFALGQNIAFGDDNSATTKFQSAANVIRVCSYDGYDTTDNSIQLAYESKLGANVPFFGFTRSGATYTTIYAEDAEIDMKTTGIAVESSDMPGLVMSGTYNASISNDDYWLYVASGGVLVRTNDDINNPSVLKTFTGFFGFSKRSTVAQKLNNANIRVRFVEYDETKSPLYNSVDEVEDENTISVEGRYGVLEVTTYKSENVTIYNVAGAQVYNATVNGTETIELPSGVYVVNGNKYIVK